MNKTEFIRALTATLQARKIKDIDEIVAEYNQHFLLKIADGYSEEEVATRLGDPQMLGAQFDPETPKVPRGGRWIVLAGLMLVDIIAVMLFLLVYSWVLLMGVAAVSVTVVGVGLALNLNLANLLPGMPDSIALIFAIMSFALAVLAVLGTVYFGFYARQLLRSYIRWHSNLLASTNGIAILPQIPAHPQIGAANHRLMRKIALVALTVFVITFQVGYILAAFSAGNLQFWHVWGWFVK